MKHETMHSSRHVTSGPFGAKISPFDAKHSPLPQVLEGSPITTYIVIQILNLVCVVFLVVDVCLNCQTFYRNYRYNGQLPTADHVSLLLCVRVCRRSCAGLRILVRRVRCLHRPDQRH